MQENTNKNNNSQNNPPPHDKPLSVWDDEMSFSEGYTGHHSSFRWPEDEKELFEPEEPKNEAQELTILERIKLYMTPWDGRFEDLYNSEHPLWMMLLRDFTAGLVVAAVAIPLAMGFAIASGLNPVHGIAGGAVAGFMGAVFGGSKYQVYGPTAALIPMIASLMDTYGANDDMYNQAYGVLVMVSIVAGIVLSLMGVAQLGRYVARVPYSIVVGFTIGIAITIFLSEIGEVIGIKEHLHHQFFSKVHQIWEHLDEFNIWCMLMAIGTAALIKGLLRISVFIPAPLVALALCVGLSLTVLQNKGLVLVVDKYGPIPSNLLGLAVPQLPPSIDFWVFLNLLYSAAAIVFVCAIESLLCSRMADRLANNNGQPYNPNKELWGQGMVNVFVPLLNGFPHTGALARTATNIKVGAVSPMAGIFKGILKLILAFLLADLLELVPMACIGGILLYVSINMVSPTEIKDVWRMNNFHRFLMIYCSVAVPVTDFLTGVLSALGIYFVGNWFGLDPPSDHEQHNPEEGAPLLSTNEKEKEVVV